MALVSMSGFGSLYYPIGPQQQGWNNSASTVMTLDAANEGAAWLGNVFIQGRAASKVISSGGGSISFRTGAVTFANAGTTVVAGIQDLTSGLPDDSFDVSGSVVGGGGGIAANSWNTVSMGTGTKTISNGDIVAIAVQMTARGGADSVVCTSAPSNTVPLFAQWPYIADRSTTAWARGAVGVAPSSAVITFDDGTLGMIDCGQPPVNTVTEETWTDSSNPDERGIVFQVPWDCKIDAFYARYYPVSAAATADFTISLYTTPLGTPAAATSVNILAEQEMLTTGSAHGVITLPSEITLSKATDYCLAIRATGAGNVGLRLVTIGNEAYRALCPGGTTAYKATRNNGSGAFAGESPAITMYQMGARISALTG